MNEMIERVARAICFDQCKVNGCRCGAERHFFAVARAAIEAMREPTDIMREEGLAELILQREHPATDPSAIFNAMIDAALTEGKPDE